MIKYIIIILLLSASAWAGSTVYSGSTYINDTYIDNTGSNATVNMSTKNILKTFGYSAFGYYKKTIIAFTNLDDSLIFGEQITDSSVISLYRYGSYGTNTDSVYVAGKVCKNVITSQCTYNIFKTGSDWDSVGCLTAGGTNCDDCWNSLSGSGIDYVETKGRETYIPNTNAWYRFEIPACHIDSFLAYPDSVNAIILAGQGFHVNSSQHFYSTEYIGTTYDPQLVIYWTEIAGYPAGVGHYPEGVGVGHAPDGQTVGHKP